MTDATTYESLVRNLASTAVLAVVAIVLTSGAYALVTISPYLLLGMPPVLLAIAAIVRAVGGSDSVAVHRSADRSEYLEGPQPPETLSDPESR